MSSTPNADYRKSIEKEYRCPGSCGGEEKPQENVETRGTTPTCLISFDDGFLSNFELAATTLNNLDIRALFFVCPGLIGMDPFEQGEAVNRFIFSNNRPVLDEPSRLALMGWSQIRDLASMSHTIGAHGMMHQRLTELTGEELSYEIVLAGDIIEEKDRLMEFYRQQLGLDPRL